MDWRKELYRKLGKKYFTFYIKIFIDLELPLKSYNKIITD